MSVHDAAACYMFVYVVFDTFFSEVACAGSIAGLDTLDTAGAECIAVLWYVCGVLNTARTGSMSSTSTEGPNTASTGSMMSSTEPRVQQAAPVVNIRNGWSTQSIESVEPIDNSSARSVYSRNNASTLKYSSSPPESTLLCDGL